MQNAELRRALGAAEQAAIKSPLKNSTNLGSSPRKLAARPQPSGETLLQQQLAAANAAIQDLSARLACSDQALRQAGMQRQASLKVIQKLEGKLAKSRAANTELVLELDTARRETGEAIAAGQRAAELERANRAAGDRGRAQGEELVRLNRLYKGMRHRMIHAVAQCPTCTERLRESMY